MNSLVAFFPKNVPKFGTKRRFDLQLREFGWWDLIWTYGWFGCEILDKNLFLEKMNGVTLSKSEIDTWLWRGSTTRVFTMHLYIRNFYALWKEAQRWTYIHKSRSFLSCPRLKYCCGDYVSIDYLCLITWG